MSDPLEDRIRAYGAVAGRATDALALLGAYEVGAFAALLGGPRTADEIGATCGVSGWRLGAFLDRVAALGFLVKEEDRYGLVAGDEGLFDPAGDRAGSLGFHDVAGTFARLGRGVEVLRTDTPLPVAGSGGEASAEERARFLRYLHTRSLAGAEEVAGRLLAGGPARRVVDLGSGLGTYTVTLLRRDPDATPTRPGCSWTGPTRAAPWRRWRPRRGWRPGSGSWAVTS